MLTRREFIVTSLALLGGSALWAEALTACAAASNAAANASSAASGIATASAASATEPAAATAAGSGELLSFNRFLFDTYIEVKAVCSPETLTAMERRLEFFEATLSRTKEGSDVYRINTAQGAPTTVQPETAELLRQALPFCERSGGLFDLTIGAVSSLWDFKEGTVPAADTLAQALTHVNYKALTVERNIVTLADPQAMIDLGGVAKGYATDELVKMLTQAGCQSALINLGGNVYALGTKPDGSPWQVGIQDPLLERGVLKAVIAARDLSVVTSGPYERSFEANGVRYHHILDPRTGYPVNTNLASATVVSASSLQCDALTTTFFLVGAWEAERLAHIYEGPQVLLVDNAGTTTQINSTAFELC